MSSTVCRGVLISEGWTRVDSTVSSFQRVGLEWAPLCPHFRGLDLSGLHCVLFSEGWTRVGSNVSSFQRVGLEWAPLCPHFRGLD